MGASGGWGKSLLDGCAKTCRDEAAAPLESRTNGSGDGPARGGPAGARALLSDLLSQLLTE